LDKNNKSIIIWPSSFFPVIGGLQTATLEIAKYLKSKNWDVSVISNRYPRNLSSKDEVEDIVINRFTLLHSPVTYLKSGRLDLFLAWLVYKPYTLIKLLIHFIKHKPDVVHIHFLDNQVFEVLLLTKIFDFKLIISFHGNDIEKIKTLSNKSVRYQLIQKMIKEADIFTGCSNFIKSQILNLFPKINSDKVHILYNGVSSEFLNQNINPKKGKYTFSVGRFVEKKGFDFILKISSLIPNIFIEIGGGTKTDLKKFGAINSKNIKNLGLLNKVDCARKFSNTSVTIIPSKKEPFGIVVAEALCCGSPIVATNVGGIPEVIEIAQADLSRKERDIFNQWVKLVEPTVDTLANGLTKVLDNKSSIEEYLEIIPKIRNQFHWETRLDGFYNSNIIGTT